METQTVQDDDQDKPFEPKVGEGATYSINGDSYPVTIRKVSKSGHQVWVSRDEFRAKPGANQPYSENDKVGVFIPRDDKDESKWELFTRRPNGRYLGKGTRYMFLSAGRSYRQDPSF